MFEFYIYMRTNSIHYSSNNTYFKPFDKTDLSFSAMKSSQFNGVDYYSMRKLKAPIEKFNSLSDFYKWALVKIKTDFVGKEFPARTKATADTRQDIINQWLQGTLVNTKQYTYAFVLSILKDITKMLKSNNDDLPLIFNEHALNKTSENIKAKISENKNLKLSFISLYKKNLLDLVPILKRDNPKEWVVIKSIPNDPLNYEDNVTRLQMLSHRTWCTKTSTARMHLMYGDIHILLENNEPHLAVRFFDNEIDEIQGVGNRGIAKKDIPLIEEYIAKNGYVLSENVSDEINKLKAKK